MPSESDEVFTRPWRSPPHLFRPNACYFVTSKTLHGEPLITYSRKQEVIDALQFACEKRGWSVIAWVVLSNHYHCLLQSPDEAGELSALFHSIHRFTSNKWNREDDRLGRHVWYRYWDSCIDRERSFWARVNYIHDNPVKHGLVAHPAQYPFSSYHRWSGETDITQLEGAYPWDTLDLEE